MSHAEKQVVHILGGPNLGRLGRRKPEIYGFTTWAEVAELCRGWAADLDLELVFDQTDGEGELVQMIHRAGDTSAGLILNAAAYTHTSVAVRDAVEAISIPVIELHLTNPDAREPFRRQNLLADVVTAGIRGFGVQGYLMALEGLAAMLTPAEE
ncbi:MAG: type II 3-dehydroquinate dehydratase [Candidatus Krumholzibacteria bacterium]|nr:type II 3-dehydroquinate dehydratase [Candidatus Krumholzibacteria bacterium]